MDKMTAAQRSGYLAYVNMAALPTDNPYPSGTRFHQQWDKGFWQAHDEAAAAAPIEETSGMEEGYGNWYDYDAVSQGYYDDDPNPYDGNYSEM